MGRAAVTSPAGEDRTGPAVRARVTICLVTLCSCLGVVSCAGYSRIRADARAVAMTRQAARQSLTVPAFRTCQPTSVPGWPGRRGRLCMLGEAPGWSSCGRTRPIYSSSFCTRARMPSLMTASLGRRPRLTCESSASDIRHLTGACAGLAEDLPREVCRRRPSRVNVTTGANLYGRHHVQADRGD